MQGLWLQARHGEFLPQSLDNFINEAVLDCKATAKERVVPPVEGFKVFFRGVCEWPHKIDGAFALNFKVRAYGLDNHQGSLPRLILSGNTQSLGLRLCVARTLSPALLAHSYKSTLTKAHVLSRG